MILVLKKQALEVLCGAHRRTMPPALGAPMPKVTRRRRQVPLGLLQARAARRRRASIRYSWRLALAPFEVADYVAAHECAHLLELNHGPRFWAHVRALVGDERRHRAWLRAEGRPAARLRALSRGLLALEQRTLAFHAPAVAGESPSMRTTRWQGMATARSLAAQACATARTAWARRSARAMSA